MIDFNYIFFGRHERGHKLITAIILLILVFFGIYQFYGSELQLKDKGVQPKEALKYQDVLALNPKLSTYVTDGNCTANFGIIYGSPEATAAKKTRLNILTFNGEVIGIIYIWSAREGWFSYAEQSNGTPVTIDGVPFYAQKILFKTPPAEKDCATAKG